MQSKPGFGHPLMRLHLEERLQRLLPGRELALEACKACLQALQAPLGLVQLDILAGPPSLCLLHGNS